MRCWRVLERAENTGLDHVGDGKPLMLNFKEFRIVREVLGRAFLNPRVK